MKKIVFFVLGVFLIVASGAAANAADLRVTPVWSGTMHDNVFNFAKRGDEYWAVANFGLLVKRSADASWTRAVKSEGGALLAIAFSPAGDGVAVGQNGVIMEAKPNSQEWTPHDSGIKDRLLGVAVSSRGDFVAVGAFGTILYRAAGSSDWKKVELPATNTDAELPHLYDAFFVTDDDAIVVGENQTLIELSKGTAATQIRLGQSAKPGEAANAETGAVTPSLFAIVYCDDTLIATGQRGVLLTKPLAPENKGKDAGSKGLLADWQLSTIDGNPDIYGLACLPTGTLVGVSNNGVILSATRHGAAFDWQRHSVGTSAEWLSAAAVINNNSVYVSGPSKILEVSFSDGK